MKNLIRPRLAVLLLLLVLGGAFISDWASAATLCADLPRSTFQVYALKASGVEEASVPAEELDRHIQPGDLVSRHTRMLSVIHFAAGFYIVHGIMPRDDGSVCDAPSLVQLTFGSSRRLVFFTPDAAENPCMRQHILDHEAAHAGAFNDVIDRFIDQNRNLLQIGMVALKQAPAPNAEIALMHWDTGMRYILEDANERLLRQLGAASAQIDSPSAIADLENACGGKIR